jgi:hemolysin activation/secretion protein
MAATAFALCLLAQLDSALAQAVAESPPAIQVQRFTVTGNSLLDPAVLDATLAAFKGRRTLAELQHAAEAVQRLYSKAGYGGVVAYLPPQAGAEGTVTVAVVEGKVAEVAVRGATPGGEAAVLASVPDLTVGRTPRVRRIDGQIELANENPSQRLQVLLKPGAKPGEIAAEVTVQQRPRQSLNLSLDDTGNERTGKYRAGLGWQHASLTGRGDVLTAQYQTSLTKPGQVTVLSAAYRLPLPGSLAVLDSYVAYSDVDGGSGDTAAGSVRINGRGNLAGLRSTWYLRRIGETDQRLGLALDRREYLNRCDVAGLGAAACGSAGSDVSVTPLSLDYALRGSGAVSWSATTTLLRNLPLGGGNAKEENFAAVRPEARRGFGVLRFAGALAAPLGEDWQLRTRLALQWTSSALVSGEQFGVGGASSVRGYQERELAGDRGLTAMLEIGGPEWLTRTEVDAPTLRPVLFVDAGSVSNARDTPCAVDQTRCTLTGAGLGLQLEGKRVQGRLAVATALKEGALTHRRDTRAHFSVSVSL